MAKKSRRARKRSEAVSAGSSGGPKIVVNDLEGGETTIELLLTGPATFEEGTALAVEINTVIARFNTLYFKDEHGDMLEPRIAAETSEPE